MGKILRKTPVGRNLELCYENKIHLLYLCDNGILKMYIFKALKSLNGTQVLISQMI